MANRSDFFNAKLPRSQKKLLAMGRTYGYIKDSHEYGAFKRAFIAAHQNHVGFKLKRNNENNRDAAESE
jgi:hypothetical protein